MNRVDLNILTHQGVNPDWLLKAVESVKGHPVNLLVWENQGNIAEGRINAIRQGSAEFICWVDSDDWLYPGAVQACIDALDAHPLAVAAYTDCILVDEAGVYLRDGPNEAGPWNLRHMPWWGGYAEHLCVMRRSVIEPLLEEIRPFYHGDCHLLRGLAAAQGDFIHVPMVGYAYRQHPANSAKQFDVAMLMRANARNYDALRGAGRLPIHRIDCHVLYCHEPKNWLEGALRSLENEPVNVHLCPGIAGHVGLARSNAFKQGSAEYVSFVDGDDEVMPGAFDAALAVLDAHPEVVSTYCDIQLIGAPDGEGYIKNEWNPVKQLTHSAEVHHLHVMRRGAVEKCLVELAKWKGFEEYLLMGLLCQYGKHYHIPTQQYRFRQHAQYPRAGAIGGQSLRKQAVLKVAPILLRLSHEI